MTCFGLRSAVLSLVSTLMISVVPAQAQDIEWRVKDRFRLWDRALDNPRVVSLEDFLADAAEARDPADFQSTMARFLATQSDLFEKAYWQEGEETYDRDYIWPTSYAAVASVPGWAGQTCTWSIRGGAIRQVRAPCAEPIDIQLAALDTSEPRRGSRPAQLSVVSDDGRRTITEIQIRDRLIASIGDSFASGEGNPDRPMDLTRLARRFEESSEDTARVWQTDWTDRWVGREGVIGPAGEARWWDQRCHRSFYSQHMVAALRYAVAHPHEATTFVSFACSGAETFRGLLGRQATPPGFADAPGAARLRYPQVEVLLANMCRRRPGTLSRESTVADQPLRYSHRDWEKGRLTDRTVVEWSWRCTSGPPRQIDALLVSIGGNDVGFGPVIQDALLPTESELAEADASALGRRVLGLVRRLGALEPAQANERIRHALPQNYALLRRRLNETLGEAPILQTVYPNPLHDETGARCGPAADRESPRAQVHSRALSALGGFWPDADVPVERRWRLVLDQAEADRVASQMIDPLNSAVRENVVEGGDRWRLVDGFEGAFARRGWCATSPADLRDALAMPNWSEGAWQSWAPQDWDPYRTRARLFRTPNDAAMTQQPANPRRRLGSFATFFERRLSRRQEALLAAMAGSFHPTFEAHAIMGWSLGEALNATPLPD